MGILVLRFMKQFMKQQAYTLQHSMPTQTASVGDELRCTAAVLIDRVGSHHSAFLSASLTVKPAVIT